MTMIPTAAGEIDSSRLGVTLMHEHLCFQASEQWQDKARDYQVLLTRQAVEVGIDTLVDLTPGPDIARIIELQEAVGEINLILSTGAYLAEAKWSAAIRDLSEDEMVAHMTRELTEGYAGFEHTGIRAGIIKIAADRSQLTDWEKKNFRAAARVQRELNVPIATHACAGAREQMEYLRSHGARIDATFYSHIEAEFGWDGRSCQGEADYLSDVCQEGGYLLFNNFGFEFDTPFEDLLYLINTLEERGYGEKIFISIDANWAIDDEGTIRHEAEKEHPQAGKRTYAYAITNAVPSLMSAGVSLQRINKYLIENPRRFFETFD